jgi:hypothetical protein
LLSCLILGDSIALGVAAALQILHFGGCDVRARNGASVALIAAMAPSIGYREIVVSAGSNDRLNPSRARDLIALRGKLRGAKVTWIYPRQSASAWDVYRVARRFSDRTVDISSVSSKDGVHPRDYIAAVRAIRLQGGRANSDSVGDQWATQ